MLQCNLPAQEHFPQYRYASSVVSSLQGESIYNTRLVSLGSAVASACSDFSVRIYSLDAASLALSLTHHLKGHRAPVEDISFVRDQPGILCSASSDGTVACWDTRTGMKVSEFRGKRDPFYSCVCRGPDIFAGSKDVLFRWYVAWGDI